MLGVRMVNLIVPDDPEEFVISGGHGSWQFTQEQKFSESKLAIEANGQCAETYIATHAGGKAAEVDAALSELLPLCFGASFLTGHAVTIRRSIPASDVQFVQAGSAFPRERSWSRTPPVVNNLHEFQAVLESFMTSFLTAGANEKIALIVHHWLDALSCWSLEDLYLSATTILQIIAATQEDRAAPTPASLYSCVAEAANHYGLAALSADFKKMRNDLIHDGTLSGSQFPGKTVADCQRVAADVLNWIDEYVHVSMGLGSVRARRFDANTLAG